MIVMYGAPPPPPWHNHGPLGPPLPQAQPPQRAVMGTGWECPRCRSINAPYITKCDCKPETP